MAAGALFDCNFHRSIMVGYGGDATEGKPGDGSVIIAVTQGTKKGGGKHCTQSQCSSEFEFTLLDWAEGGSYQNIRLLVGDIELWTLEG